MRTLLWGLAVPLLIGMVSCSGGGKSPSTPPTTSGTPLDLEQSALPGGDAMPGLVGTAALGGYRIDLDLGAVPTASVTPWRHNAETDDVYFLSVDNFLRGDSLRVTGVTLGASTLDISYIFEHPFAAPTNLAGPATAANRADLGIAARMLFLTDLPTGAVSADYTYFTGEAIANTALITNADGYYKPGPLLPNLTGMTANVFPYKLVVNEGAGTSGNRVDITNGGNGAGNYKPASGWQGDNIAGPTSNNGWTGYGVLHQGQAATNTVTLDLTTLLGEPGFSFDVAILAKYTDPRGGTNATQKRANRLPSVPENVFNFVYRMPFGAIDAERVRSQGETGGLLPNSAVSSTTVRFYVRDADARAIPTSRPDLSEDPDPKTIQVGSQGVPSLTIDIPGVTTTPAIFNLVDDDTAHGGDAASDSGLAFDDLYYEALVQNGFSSGQVAGDAIGMVKVVDPENGIDRTDWEFILDPNLVPQTSGSLPVVTYGRARVTLGAGGNLPPTATPELTLGLNPTVASAGALDFQITAENDPDSDPVLYDIDVDDDGTFEATGLDPVAAPPPAVALFSGTAPVNGGAVPVAEQARVLYYDAAHAGTPTVVVLDYMVNPVGANSPPTATISLQGGPTPLIPSGGDITYLLDAENDPDADTVTYAIDYNFTGVFSPDAVGIDPAAPPSTLHVSSGQVNPGGTTLPRTTRIQYSDGINPAVTVNLTYDLGPASCSAQTLSFNFDANSQGWIEGDSFFYGPSLPNSDLTGWGQFTHGCNVSETETRSGGAISGEYWTSGDDGGCSFMYDHGSTATYNVISPFITVPSICTPGSLQARFNMMLFARSASSARMYISIDTGATWGAPVWTQNGNDAEQILTNTTVALPDALQGESILVRFEFTDPTALTYGLPSPYNTSNNGVGVTMDLFELTAGATGPFDLTPPTFPCQMRTLTFDYAGPQAWVAGDLFTPPVTNTDLQFGWGGFQWNDCDPGFSTTQQAVITASGGAITGTSLGVTSDFEFCTFEDDYGGDALYNVVGPKVVVPTICSGQVNILFNAYLNIDDSNYFGVYDGASEDGADTGVVVRCYMSLDNGVTWNAPVWTQTATLAGQTWTNQSINVTGLAGNANGVRLRFEFDATFTNSQQDDPLDPFGFYVDNVRFVADDTNSIFTYAP